MTMKKPVAISLVIPVYGVEQYIAEFACSVFSQNYPNVQFVFVNDGTKDNSIKVLKDLIDDKFQSLKERIIIVDKENRTITIKDNGIGMTYDEIINNLGTIAKSGSAEFINNLKFAWRYAKDQKREIIRFIFINLFVVCAFLYKKCATSIIYRLQRYKKK